MSPEHAAKLRDLVHGRSAAALGTLRFSVGRFTTREDVDGAAPLILSAVAAVRSGR